LVPEARAAMDRLRGQVVDPASVPYANTADKGNLTTRQAGEMGGEIGGSMVRKLIEIAEQELSAEQGLSDPHS
jgi:hypothetical protein